MPKWLDWNSAQLVRHRLDIARQIIPSVCQLRKALSHTSMPEPFFYGVLYFPSIQASIFLENCDQRSYFAQYIVKFLLNKSMHLASTCSSPQYHLRSTGPTTQNLATEYIFSSFESQEYAKVNLTSFIENYRNNNC
jgi:hypothetical protein